MREPERVLTSWAWGQGEPPARSLPSGFFAGGSEALAVRLLGQRLVSEIGGHRTEGVIVETEAYMGPDDPASHAAARIGRTTRNDSMFGPGGHAYVYFIYGMHWCMNVVAEPEGFPSAVLVRALEPLGGLDAMRGRRGREPLASGPARLCQALGIDGRFDGHDLRRHPLRLLAGWQVPAERIGRSGRIGVRHAADLPLRFFLRGHPAVSA